MLQAIKNWFLNDSEFYSDLNVRLHLAGRIAVGKDIIRTGELFNEGYIYEMELVKDGFFEITAHKKADLVPDNVVKICY